MKIINKVTSILSELSSMENVCLEHKLQTDLGLNSLQLVTLLMMLEENFQIVLNESDMNPYDLIDVCHVVKLVENYVGGDDNEYSEKEN